MINSKRLSKFLSFSFIIILLILGIFLTKSLVSYFLTVENRGVVRAVGGVRVYEDENCSIPLTFIDWGFMNPNSIETRYCYMKNVEQYIITVTMWTGNWSSEEASDCVSLSWNREFIGMNPNQVVETEFYLSVSPDVYEDLEFSFDIVVYGEET